MRWHNTLPCYLLQVWILIADAFLFPTQPPCLPPSASRRFQLNPALLVFPSLKQSNSDRKQQVCCLLPEWQSGGLSDVTLTLARAAFLVEQCASVHCEWRHILIWKGADSQPAPFLVAWCGFLSVSSLSCLVALCWSISQDTLWEGINEKSSLFIACHCRARHV